MPLLKYKKPRWVGAGLVGYLLNLLCEKSLPTCCLRWQRYFLGFRVLTVLVVFDGVALTGLPVASTGLFEVAALGMPAVLDRLGAVSLELA